MGLEAYEAAQAARPRGREVVAGLKNNAAGDGEIGLAWRRFGKADRKIKSLKL